MNKTDFINRLRWFWYRKGEGLTDEYGHPEYACGRGEDRLAWMLSTWLEESESPDDPIDGSFTRHIPQLVVEAYAEFASSPRWESERSTYRRETGHDIPDLVDVYAGGIHRVLVAHSVCRLMPLLTGERWLETELEATLGAQMKVIDHSWRRFVRLAYRKLMPRIKSESHRGNAGVFGTTTLMTFDCAGRVMFTFSRGEATMTYVADASDMYGLRSGPNKPGAPYAECVAMIDDVIAHWDIDKLVRSDTIGWG